MLNQNVLTVKVLYNYVDVLVILLLCYFVMEWKLWYFFLLKQLSKISQLASRMCDGEWSCQPLLQKTRLQQPNTTSCSHTQPQTGSQPHPTAKRHSSPMYVQCNA